MNDSTPAAERFGALYDAAYLDVLRYVRRRELAAADDVVAEAMLVAWRRIDEVPREPGDARAWLFGVARGCLLNQRRSARRQDAVAVRLAAEQLTDGPTADPAAGYVARAALVDAWARLSAEEQELIAMSVLDGLTGAQAAHILGITPVAFRHRLSRARAALRRHLDDSAAPVAVPTRRSSPEVLA